MMDLNKFYSEFESQHKGEEAAVNWLKSYREEWMTDDQWLCALFLNRLFCGFHHIHAPFRRRGKGVCINTRTSYLATFDYDTLTKAVIMAHNWGVRLEVGSSAPGMIKLSLWKRHAREGNISLRHPTIEQAVEKYKDF